MQDFLFAVDPFFYNDTGNSRPFFLLLKKCRSKQRHDQSTDQGIDHGENVIPHKFRHGIDTLNQSLHLLSSAPDPC